MRMHLHIAYSTRALSLLGPIDGIQHELIEETNFTQIGTVIITDGELHYLTWDKIKAFGMPVFLIVENKHTLANQLYGQVYSMIDLQTETKTFYTRQIENAMFEYESRLLSPFFKRLVEYTDEGNSQFDCPGHQGGAYFRAHPAGRMFYDFYGENTFRADLCNADVAMGDLLTHEGVALQAQKYVAKVFNADKAYFILNGSSGANKVVMNALLSPGDFVLYERNNHKSVAYGALFQAGATPLYMETARNPYGLIGGTLDHCFNEEYIRNLIAEKNPKRAVMNRPIRAAILQLGTYDGCIYNAKQVIEKIGHLCDYIVFDSAWVGYEQFIPMMKDCSPLLMELGPEDPGIIVIHSVHKQLAGFSQASQVLKKDKHIKGQKRYLPHKILNNAFMINSSTSPNYQIFASLEMNAKMQEGESGKYLWHQCLLQAIEARKAILRHCKYFRPIVPHTVHNRKWEDSQTADIAKDISYFSFEPGGKWHSFQGYTKGQFFIDPMKLQLTTLGINMENGEYEVMGIPAIIVAAYLRDNHIIPEKCDLNNILFLLTPGETKNKLNNLISKLVAFERRIDNDAPMEIVLPTIYKQFEDRYRGYTIRQLCAELHNIYKDKKINILQKKMFLKAYFPEYVMRPQEANWALTSGEGELIPLRQAEGRIALQLAVPYPPGISCIQAGERWTRTALDYFLDFIEIANRLPGFEPKLQGVYSKLEGDTIQGYCYVLAKEYENKYVGK